MLPPPSLLVEVFVAVAVILALSERVKIGVLIKTFPALPALVVWTDRTGKALSRRIKSKEVEALTMIFPPLPVLEVSANTCDPSVILITGAVKKMSPALPALAS
jgi:hypothetical protein